MIAIVESRADRASVHVCDYLRELVDWERRGDDTRPDGEGGSTWYRTDGAELRSFDDLHIELERPADAFEGDPDLLVFASRHSGGTGPLLTGHFTGNFGPAEFGGDDGELAATCPNALATLLESFDEYAPADYDVGMECTHHGPTDVGVPSLFAELGSDDEQWNDPAGAEAVARAILDLRDVAPHRDEQVVGFGGNHYAPRFTRIVRETPWAVGHVAADWALEAMAHPETERDVLAAAFEESDADCAVIDGEYPTLERVLDALGYEVVSETWLREVGDRPRSLVTAIEDELGTVDDGVRFGSERSEPFTVVDLPVKLVETAEGIDPDEVWAILENRTVAFTTRNGASRVGDRAAVPGEEVLQGVVADLAAILECKYDTVAIEDDAVVVSETAFDPKRARELGVSEGPAFGRLTSGDTVTVDGRTVAPEDVHVDRTHRFPV
ncbi:D-aminoacyl-tRNA deacylase [Natronobeatus ordinarius]|uniref:D-aminoacyl-tRNA deacylase n=1 Tax=Natronobeatus ordinarius TaxID=2963433 RepID=UPI0020CE9B04|nr:D-aminoacyl-tRNA deacylase [Natronobeatus ordinarius]